MKNRSLAILLTLCTLSLPWTAMAQTPDVVAQQGAPTQTTTPTTSNTAPSPSKRRAIERLKQHEATPPRKGYGSMLLQMIVALAVVCALAFVILKWGLKRLISGRHQGARMEVLERLPIEPRRAVVVVRVGARTLVLGSSEAGVELLTELHGAEASEFQRSPETTGKHTKAHQQRADVPLTSHASDASS